MRRVNSRKLKEWLDGQGDDAKVQLHLKSKVSLNWIEKAASGRYDSEPGRLIRDAICGATGLREDELFPVVSAKGKAS